MDPQKLSAQELVQLCLASQDPALWNEFVRRFQPPIARAVIKTLGKRPWIHRGPALVDDLTQDTFLKLCANNYRALRDFHFDHENSIFPFLTKIASNVAEDYVRNFFSQKRGSGRGEEDLEEASAAAGGHTNSPDRQILFDQILRCLQRLSSQPNFKRDLTIFQLYYFQGLTAAAIGDLPEIGLGVKTVESILMRLIRFLKGMMGGDRGHHA